MKSVSSDGPILFLCSCFVMADYQDMLATFGISLSGYVGSYERSSVFALTKKSEFLNEVLFYSRIKFRIQLNQSSL